MINEKKRTIAERKTDAAKLLKKHKSGKPTREDAIAYVEEVRGLTDATSTRPASYFLDEGCSPEDVVEHFRAMLPKQTERLEKYEAERAAQVAARADAKRRAAKDPKNRKVG